MRRVAGLLLLLACVAVGATPASAAAKHHRRVLLVGTYRHHHGGYKTIQGAVDAARPGDWILVGPGDYHERADHRKNRGSQPADTPAGVIITKPRIHLRGMNRNGVVVDGTLPGKGKRCSSKESRQDLGVKGDGGDPLGGSGKIGMGSFRGTYLNATSTFFKDTSTAAGYGLFSSNSRGPGVWDHTYASNFDDADYYIGACAQVCHQLVNHARAQYAALGYS